MFVLSSDFWDFMGVIAEWKEYMAEQPAKVMVVKK